MSYNMLQQSIYEYGLSIIAAQIAMPVHVLVSKISGQEEFTGTEIIAISKLIGIDNPEKIFLH